MHGKHLPSEKVDKLSQEAPGSSRMALFLSLFTPHDTNRYTGTEALDLLGSVTASCHNCRHIEEWRLRLGYRSDHRGSRAEIPRRLRSMLRSWTRSILEADPTAQRFHRKTSHHCRSGLQLSRDGRLARTDDPRADSRHTAHDHKYGSSHAVPESQRSRQSLHETSPSGHVGSIQEVPRICEATQRSASLNHHGVYDLPALHSPCLPSMKGSQ